MQNAYFLVSWIYETPIRKSVMSQGDIVDSDKRRLAPAELIGTEVEFRWIGKQICTGQVVAHACTKDELSAQITKKKGISVATSSVPTTNLGKGKRLKQKQTEKVQEIIKKVKLPTVLAQIQTNNTPVEDPKDVKIRELEEKLEKSEKVIAELTNDLAEARAQANDNDAVVDIGNGVLVQKHTITAFRTVSGNYCSYARNLFRHLYSKDEVIGYSFMGKACNATTKVSSPSIDSRRRDAILEHSLLTFGKKPGTELYNLALNKVKKSMGSLVQEITRDAKIVIEELQADAEARKSSD